MTTDEEGTIIPIVRDIRELLELDTYQGMSDDEIEMIIDYRVSNALIADEQQATRDAIETSMQAQLDTYRQVELDSQDVLQSALGTSVPWVRVGADGTVVQDV